LTLETAESSPGAWLAIAAPRLLASFGLFFQLSSAQSVFAGFYNIPRLLRTDGEIQAKVFDLF